MSRFTGFHMTSFKFKTKELFYFYEVLEQLKTNVCTDFLLRGGSSIFDLLRFNFYDFSGATRYLHSSRESCRRLDSYLFWGILLSEQALYIIYRFSQG